MPTDDDRILSLEEARKPIFAEAKSLFGDKYQQKIPPPIGSTKQAIEWLNETFFTTYIKGRYKVVRENSDGTYEFMEKKDFMNGLDHMRLLITAENGNPKSTPITEIWLRSPSRRRFENGLEFNPAFIGNRDEKYNLWKGWNVKPVEGDVVVFLDYMKTVICAGDEHNYNFLVALIAQMFQFPHLKPGIAVVIRGDEGVGKSFFVEKLGDLAAPYYFKTSNPAYVFGDHNGQLKDKIMLHLEEAVWAGSKKDESLLKDLITGRTIEINEKYIPVYSVANHLHLFITGNPLWLVSAGFQARRIFALHASETHIRDTKYFSALDEWFHKEGGAAALMYFFLNHKSDIDLRLAPVTEELIVQKRESMSGVEAWLDNLIASHEMPYGKLVGKEEQVTLNGVEGTVIRDARVEVIKKALYYDYLRSQHQLRSRVILNDKKFGARLLQLLPLVVNGVVQKHANQKVVSVINPNIKCNDNFGAQRDGYSIPSWSVVRGAFDFALGVKESGEKDNTEWIIQNTFYPDEKDWRNL
jgi:Family of unknown function (DUF5906)